MSRLMWLRLKTAYPGSLGGPPSPALDYLLREDGTPLLREDGTPYLREAN